MKNQKKRIAILTLIFISMTSVSSTAQSMNKKTKQLRVERIIDLPAAIIWNAMGVDYGNIANSHPTIVSSTYKNGTLQGSLGAERQCNFNENGNQFLHEKIVKWDPEHMSFSQKIVNAKKFPIDKDNTLGIYSVEALGPNKCKVIADLKFRTKPAFMGGMVKGKFRKLLEDYFIALEHNAKTGEKVTIENFKHIKKQYKS